MVRKVLLGGGAAAVLSLGVLIGGLTTGLVGAHSQQTPTSHAQGADDGEDPDAPIAVPTGSVSADQAKQAAQAYVSQTAPYSSQGLRVQGVTVDDEDGTVVYTVKFTGSNGQQVEVVVSTQGTVLKAETDADDTGDPND